jgi:pyruvate,water dikinase
MSKKWGHDARLAQTLITGLTDVYAAKMGPALQQIAQELHDENLVHLVMENSPQVAWNKLQSVPEASSVRHTLAQFLQEHGHRCPAEPEISLPRWAEAPEQIIALVLGYVTANPIKSQSQERSLAESAQQTIEKQIGPFRRSLFRRILRRAKQQVRRRDNSRHFMAKLELCRRQLFMALGHRWHERGILWAAEDIFFLTHDEIDLIIKGNKLSSTESLSESIAARRQAYEFWCSYPIPEALDSGDNPLTNSAASIQHGLQGVPASGGIATGPVRIIHHPKEVVRLQPGDILVTLATDPGWTPVFPLVAGLILVYGGQLSHGAIVAREYGVPAVVNVPEAMSQLHEGMIVTIDGNKGNISW